MANLSKVLINEFSAGTQTSDRREVQGGATLIKNFNIYEDGRRLKPVPAWESCVTDTEKNLGIIALGGPSQGSTTVLGVGKGLSNWLTDSYKFRVKVTPQSTSTADYTFIDLAEHMPPQFWTEVLTTGFDIVPTSSNQTPLQFNLIEFNKSTNEGKLIINAAIDEVFIYFGFADAGSLLNGYTGMFSNSGATRAYPLDGDAIDYIAGIDLDGPGSNYLPAQLTDSIGQAFGDPTTIEFVKSNNNGDLGLEAGYSFVLYVRSLPGSTVPIIQDSFNTIGVFLRSDGKLECLLDTTGGGTDTIVSNAVLPLLTRVYVSVQYNNTTAEFKIWLDDVVDTTYTGGSGNLDNQPGDFFVFGGNNGASGDWAVEFLTVSIGQAPKDDTRATTEGKMIARQSAFWTAGPIEARTGLSPEYDGTAIYQKDIATTDGWSDYFIGNFIAKTLDFYPQSAFLVQDLDNNNTQLIVREGQDPVDFSFRYLSKLNPTGLVWDDTQLVGTDRDNNSRIARGVDKDYYFTFAADVNNIDVASDTVVLNAFTPFADGVHLTPFGQYMSIVSTEDYRSYCNIWDLDSSTSSEFIEIGQGKVRAVGNIYGTMFFVVNNAIDNSVLASGQASLDIRVWTGGPYAENFITLETPANVDGYYNTAVEAPVLNQVEYIKNAFVFYARIPDRNGVIQEGLWSIGKSETSQTFGLALYKDTSDLGDVTYIYRTGNVLFAIHGRDGSISRISADTYSDLSEWESIKYMGNASENVKKLTGAEITFDELPEGQEIVMYYRTTTDAAPLEWKELGRIKETGAVKKEITNIETDGTPLPSFNEIEFRLTSQFGPAAITSWGFTSEDTTDLTK